MSADQNPIEPSAEDRMTILERRLAEIQAKAGSAPAERVETENPASATETPGSAQIEMPAQGTPPLPEGQPAGAGTAEPVPAPADAAPVATAPAPNTPEAAAAAETAQHVPDSVTVDGSDMSAPQARAVAHYGEEMVAKAEAPAVEAAPETAGENPAVAEEAPAIPTAPADATPVAEAKVALEAEAAPPVAETVPDASAETPEPIASTAPALVADPETSLNAGTAPGIVSATESEAASLTSAAPVAASEETSTEEATAADADDASEADSEAETELPAPDFTELDLPAQAAYLVQLLRRPDARKHRKQIQDLTRQYEANVGSARSAARQKFAEGGNEAEAFAFQQPEGQQELNKALQEFRESRQREAKAEDASRSENLVKKNALLDQLRTLVEAADTKDSSGKLKALQAEWKAVGPVPQADSQANWDTYHGLLDIYYSKQGRFHEMRDLDRRRNLEAKEALIKRAEALKDASGINKALDELTKLHEEWKSIGPVPNEQREPLWQRFIAASDGLHQRRKEFADQRSGVEKANLEVKKALLDRILPFADFDTDRVNLWRSKTDEIQEIKQEWEAAGLVPRAQADALNKQYWNAYKAFFNRKNEFFKSLDNEKNTNLKAKLSLIEQAEEALNSPDWEAARNTVIRVQKEWKDIGRVPEKQADKIWHRFRTACDNFFDRPKNEARQREERVTASSAEQTAHLEKLSEEVSALTKEEGGTLEGFRAIIADWSAAFDPTEDQPGRGTGDRSEEQLLGLLGKYLDCVPALSYADRNELLFQAEIARLKARPQAQQQLTKKEMALRKEINELENDNATLQTNLDFFARSKNAAQLREEYQGRMEEGRKRIEVLKKQLKAVRS
ncbi:DUF349 domain-containing protein [Hymenobacter sp. ASUV-10]|uniref:DUF349 domain-containing protein n=1 Tax=Hymenobacter aranciens TaxID=3063996 RepID=A0ABT9B9N6_9BACT|nr:DUF349 domain-containing protein [Hymenobacter sp. ASUV-10]MDO7873747.1 DUF349 domain-containing protein [Hymenobacter sp. ASUV-10]